MKKIDARLMHEKLKCGWTTERFLRYLDATEDEFLEALKKIFSPNTFRAMKADLEKNDKRFLKYATRVKNKKRFSPNTNSETKVDESLQDDNISMSQLLKSLQEEESVLRNQLYEQEVAQSKLRTRRTELFQFLETEKTEMLFLKEKIQQHKQKLNEAIFELNHISEKMSDLKQNMAEQKEKISEIQAEIRILKKVVVYVYDNGEIESDNFEVEIINSWEDSCNKKFSEILELEDVQVLRVNQVKQLSKILVLAQHLKEQDFEFEITFESNLQQEIYEKVS